VCCRSTVVAAGAPGGVSVVAAVVAAAAVVVAVEQLLVLRLRGGGGRSGRQRVAQTGIAVDSSVAAGWRVAEGGAVLRMQLRQRCDASESKLT